MIEIQYILYHYKTALFFLSLAKCVEIQDLSIGCIDGRSVEAPQRRKWRDILLSEFQNNVNSETLKKVSF